MNIGNQKDKNNDQKILERKIDIGGKDIANLPNFDYEK